MRSALPLAALAAGSVLLVTGCGVPPELRESPQDPPPPAPPSTSPTPGLPSPVAPGGPGTPSAGGFPEEIAIDCAGSPGAEQVLELLRSEDMLAPDSEAEVAEGPFCSGEWQYAVVNAPDLDPLLVVSRGEPDALELVTAGTDVCTVEVRIQAPAGIRGAATCTG